MSSLICQKGFLSYFYTKDADRSITNIRGVLGTGTNRSFNHEPNVLSGKPFFAKTTCLLVNSYSIGPFVPFGSYHLLNHKELLPCRLSSYVQV